MTFGRSDAAERLAGRSCVVTGGLGFIGSNVVRHLLEAGADVIFNMAGQVSHHDSMRDFDLNVRSHLVFLETARRVAPNTTIVQTSTRQVYGRPLYLPVDERHPTNPVDVNGVDKLACEQLHLVYSNVYGLHATSLRLTNVYGPQQHLERTGLGMIPFLDLTRRLERFEPEYLDAVSSVMRSGTLLLQATRRRRSKPRRAPRSAEVM